MNSQDRLDRTRLGFSLVELMLAIAIVAIISAASIPFSTSFLSRTNLKNKTNELVSLLNVARINSMSGKAGSAWGVYSDGSTLVLFAGDTYATRDSAYDVDFDVPGSVVISTFEILFERNTGDTGLPSVISLNDDTVSVSVSVNELGVANVN